MSKPEKLTLVVEQETREELIAWAREDGKRSVTSLLRSIVDKSLADRRRQGVAGHEIAA
jgi:hypothetical protein